jgi:YD repeat-containing protein
VRVSTFSLLVALLAPATARASGLDVERWLDRPGVRLVAVEFYATWCKPCMAAVPKWKALHEKFRDRGLRLIVVATQDPKAGCANPGWNPDDVVCDDDGAIAAKLGAGDALPAAFLWSWQGELIVKKGHVQEVETAIERWFSRAARVSVEAGTVDPAGKISGPALRDLVRARVRDTAKLEVVATAAEQAKLDRLKAESLKSRYDERMQCEIGKELPANALLEASITARDGKPRLHLSLLSAEKGCLVASNVVDWRGADPSAIVAESVAELLQKLKVAAGAASAPTPAATPTGGGITVAVPRIDIQGSTQLGDVNIDAERKLEAAQDAQEDPKATHRQKADAWCALAKVGGKNPYKKDADAACKKWLAFVKEAEALETKLAADYQALTALLQLKRRSDGEKKQALDSFLGVYASLADPRVAKLKGIQAAWPLTAAQLDLRLRMNWPVHLLLYTAMNSDLRPGLAAQDQFPRAEDHQTSISYRVEHRLRPDGLPSESIYTGHQTGKVTWSYDERQRLVRRVSEIAHGGRPAIRSETTYEYGAGELPTKAKGQSKVGGNEYVYGYDGAGRLVREQSRDLVSTFSYDAEGRWIGAVSQGGGADPYRATCGYTHAARSIQGRCSARSGGWTSTLDLDDRGRVTRYLMTSGSSTETVTFTY